ncbi:MAG TPA: SPFH domain-containing protein [Candidatus Avibacteroides excrementipullorum]|jgi:regulator of protease activity HflC (stomatin/prohibitin superfamily)|nr:SPFH domain-containing protein [Candidatus Avibacteroides excrementipullorum]
MENKEFIYKGARLNGFLAILVNLFFIALAIYLTAMAQKLGGSSLLMPVAIFSFIWSLVMLGGYFSQEPNEVRVMVFFGKYKGTFKDTGFFWVNPFLSKKRLSLRARNIDAEPIKVNDKIGNPVLIGMVLVWKLKDTYKAMFEIDAQTMAQTSATGVNQVSSRMNAFEKFVRIQSDAALRQVAGLYAYDNMNEENNSNKEMTLRSGGEEINEQLEQKLNERLAMAGIEIIEARINYLAYAPEIAAVMLKRQQATAIIAAKEKIVEGAVSMVKMALEHLENDGIVELDKEKRAAMVSNLLVVLCSDKDSQPIINTGSLNQR